MKSFLLILIAVLPTGLLAQVRFESLKEANGATEDGLKMPSGWVIKKGDKITTGRGTMPNKSFAYIYEAPGITLNISRTPLPAPWSNKEAVVKKITFSGTKRTGFTPIVVVGVGLLTNYYVDINSAIDAGEIIVPSEFAKKDSAPGTPAPATSVTDELKKLKELLDTGALTQEEYNAQKKKLLGQ